MTLLDLAKSLIALYHQDWTGSEEENTQNFEVLFGQFMDELHICEDETAMEAVLGLNLNLDMPFEVVKAVYERLMALGRGNDQTKRGYALWLKLHGPDWDAEADAILRELGETWDTKLS